MPLYEYFCNIHGEFDVEHSIHEKLETCPKCQEENLESQKVVRLISGGTNFHLVGGGWSRDNYK